MEFTAEIIAGYLDGEIEGDKDAKVNTFAKIEEGCEGALSFLSNPKYEQYIYSTDSTVVIVNKSFEAKSPVKATLIRVADAYGAFAKLLKLYESYKPRKEGISEKADIAASAIVREGSYVGAFSVIEEGADLGYNVRIYPHVYIGEKVRIGDNTTIYAGAKIYEGCVIGSNVVVHAGAVIGADGFGFAPDADGKYHKIPQIGNVVIEDDVEIGANTCIDRATMGSTIIHKGVKLDNLIQVGHNAVIGENTVAAAQTGVAGTSKVGKNCMFGGQVGIAGHITIANNVHLGSQSGVSNNIDVAGGYLGSPALPGMQFHRSHAIFKRLQELNRSVFTLEKQMRETLDNKAE